MARKIRFVPEGGALVEVTVRTPRFYQRLEELEQLVEGESKASVIRQALQQGRGPRWQ